MAAQTRTPVIQALAPEPSTLDQIRATIGSAPPEPLTGPTIEVVGRRVDPFAEAKQRIALEMAVAEAILPHQLHEIDAVVEIAHVKQLLDEKDARISFMSLGIAQWRERAIAESDARRREQQVAHERERDLVRVIHKQMSAVDSAVRETIVLRRAARHANAAAQARVSELEGQIDELQEQLHAQFRPRRWWQIAG